MVRLDCHTPVPILKYYVLHVVIPIRYIFICIITKPLTSLSWLLAISVNLKQRSTPTLNTCGLVDKYFPVPQPIINEK